MDKEFLLGGMMEEPLITTGVLAHAEAAHGPTEIVSKSCIGSVERSSWDRTAKRARQLGSALLRAGVALGGGQRIATLAWNSARHLELYYAVPGIGAVLHTLNPRLFLDELLGIMRHAEDAWVFVDPAQLPLARQLHQAGLTSLHWVLMGELQDPPLKNAHSFEYQDYESFLATGALDWDFPRLNERMAAMLCYTSGTTGDPKGVLSSHRSMVLHAMALMAVDGQRLSARDTVLAVVPMFHASAWGLPYLTAMVGAKLVLPGPHVDGDSLFRLMEEEGVTVSVGIPTVWWGLLSSLRRHGRKPRALTRLFVGGAACPPSLGDAFDREWGIEMIQGWGMTETSPVGTMSWPRHDTPPEDRSRTYRRQGRALFGVRVRIVDEHQNPLPHDGVAMGELQVQGHWVIAHYFKASAPLLNDGWFATGDVARIDPEGSIEITDRVKDMIRSGGEWISSVAIETRVLGCPGVEEAAAIAVPDPKWGERPLLVVVPSPDGRPEKAQIEAHLRAGLASWQVPEQIVFMEELPKTALGKVAKRVLRQLFQDKFRD